MTDWQCLAFKKIGDDVQGSFVFNAPLVAGERFDGGIADFSEDFLFYNLNQTKADANWISNDSTKQRVNVTNNNLDFNVVMDGTNDAISFDLWTHGIFPSNTNWTLRFKLRFSTLTADTSGPEVLIGLASLPFSSGNTVVQDWIGFTYLHSLTFKQWNLGNADGAVIPVGGTGDDAQLDTLAISTDYFFEIKRTGATSYEVTKYSDSSYMTPIRKARGSCSAGITTLRYIKILNRTLAGLGGTGIGTFDDIQFFNNSEGAVDQFVVHSDELDDVFVPFVAGTPTKTITGADDGNWVIVDGFYSVVGGKVSGWGTEGAVQHRATYDLLTNDAITVDPANWTFDFEFRFTFHNIPAHIPFALSNVANSIDQFPPTVDLRPSVMFLVSNAVTTVGAVIQVNDGANNSILSSSIDLTAFLGVSLYPRVQRINTTKFKLSIFSDVARTLHIANSPVMIDANVSGSLNFIHSSNLPSGGLARQLTGFIDFIKLYNGSAESGSLALSDNFSTYGSPVNPDFVDLIPNSTGWITTNSTRIRADNNLQNIYSLTEASGLNNSIAKDLTIVGTTPVLQPVTFSDNFAVDNWIDVGTDYFVGSGVNNFTLKRPSLQDNYDYRDIGITLSNTEWTMRFKIEFTTNTTSTGAGTYLWVVMSSTSGGDDTVQDSIGMGFVTSVSQNTVFLAFSDGAGLDESATGGFTEFVGLVARYVEVTRISATLAKIEVFSDSGFSISLGSSMRTIPSTVNQLRFVKMSSWNIFASTYNGTQVGYIDDLEIWNGPRMLSNQNFLLRFQMNALAKTLGNTVPKSLYIGFSDKDQTFDELTSQSLLMAYLDVNSVVTGGIALVHASNVVPASIPLDLSMTRSFGLETLFIEIGRSAKDSAHIAIYQDEDYKHLIEKRSFTNGGADPDLVLMNQLRYLKFMNHDASIGTGSWEGTFDDIRFWNARPDSCDLVMNTPFFTDNFTSYANQVAFDTAYPVDTFGAGGFRVRGNPTNDNIDFAVIGSDTATDNRSGLIHDFGFGIVSDTAWTLRCKIAILSHSSADINYNDIYIGMGDVISSDLLVVQDFIGFNLHRGTGTIATYRIIDSNNAIVDQTVDATFVRPLISETIYVEIKRRDATNYSVELFQDSSYTISLEKQVGICSSAIVNLRYFKIMSRDQSGAGTIVGTVDDLIFYNGFASPFDVWINSPHAFVDPCQQNIQYNYDGDGTVEGIYRDLGLALSPKWVFREKVFFGSDGGTKPASDTISVAHGISSVATQSSNVSVDGIFFEFLNSSVGAIPTNRTIKGHICNSALPIDGSATATVSFTRIWNPGETLFIEIVRESDILARFSLFSDSDYTFLIESKTVAIPANSVFGLRFIQYSGRVLNRAGVITHSIDNVKVWNNTDVADPISANSFEILSHYQPTGGIIRGLLNFNLDSSNNYAQRRSDNGSADITNPSQPALFGQNYNEVFFQRYAIHNELMIEKLIDWAEMSSPLGVVAPQRVETVGKWAIASKLISRFLIRDDQAGLIAPDSEFLVFGNV